MLLEVTVPVTCLVEAEDERRALGAAVFVLDALLPPQAPRLMGSAGVEELRYDTTVVRATAEGPYLDEDGC